MRIRWGYQTVYRTLTDSNFDGLTASVADTLDAGRFVLENRAPQGLRDMMIPYVMVSYRSNELPTEITCLLFDRSEQYEIPVIGSPSQAMKLIYRDDAPAAGFQSGYDFIEDNLGQGWPVPIREDDSKPWELLLVTDGIAVPETRQVWTIETWYEFAPHSRWWGKALCSAIEGLDTVLKRATATPSRGSAVPTGRTARGRGATPAADLNVPEPVDYSHTNWGVELTWDDDEG